MFQGKGPAVLTYNEKNLHRDVTDRGASGRGQLIITNKAHVVRYSHGNIKRCQQNQPVPASFKSAKMQKYEFGLLCIRNFVLRKCGFVYENVLWVKTWRREMRNPTLETGITQLRTHLSEVDHFLSTMSMAFMIITSGHVYNHEPYRYAYVRVIATCVWQGSQKSRMEVKNPYHPMTLQPSRAIVHVSHLCL